MNGKELSGKEKLREALNLCEAQYTEERQPFEGNIQYSKQYIKQMEKILSTGKRTEYLSWKYIAIAASIVVIAVGILLSPIRETTVQFLKNTCETLIGKHEQNRIPPMQIEDPEWLYSLTYIPKGYQLVEKTIGEANDAITIFEHEEKGEIVLIQYPKGEVMTDAAGHDFRWTLSTDRFDLKWQIQGDMKIYWWTSGDYDFILEMPLHTIPNDVIEMIDSLENSHVPYDTKPKEDKHDQTIYYYPTVSPFCYLRKDEKGLSFCSYDHQIYHLETTWSIREPIIKEDGIHMDDIVTKKIVLKQYQKNFDSTNYQNLQLISNIEREGFPTVKRYTNGVYDIYSFTNFDFEFVMETPCDMNETDMLTVIDSLALTPVDQGIVG